MWETLSNAVDNADVPLQLHMVQCIGQGGSVGGARTIACIIACLFGGEWGGGLLTTAVAYLEVFQRRATPSRLRRMMRRLFGRMSKLLRGQSQDTTE